MPTTYEPIATTTLGSATNTVTFSSIPSTYTDLIVVIRTQLSAVSNQYIKMNFNNDTGSNYSNTRLLGNGSSATSDRASNATDIDSGFMPAADGTGQGTIIANIMNYSNSTTYKTSLIRWESQAGVSTKQYVAAEVALWRSTSSINEIDLVSNNSNFNSGSTFTLYGIKAA